MENSYIKKYKPKYNIKLTDDKAYPMVRITIEEKYPKVLTVRRPNDNPPAGGSIYFGPFPNGAKALRIVLKTIRRIFPYQSVPNHARKICLYYHLRLCPCPPVFNSPEFKKEYRKNIKHIVDFLNGNAKKIIKDLKKERNALSENEEFEKANFLQSKIKAIELITGPFYKTGLDLNIDPNLTDDLRKKEIQDLIDILNKNNINVKTLERIECYDISNISGTSATGSMVTFINGEKDGSKYRKFKIKTLNSPNDFGMMEEVLQRRIKHSEWPYPNLLIVDGGKGQVSTALKVLEQTNKNIPVIGLAKKEETIVTSDLKEISLPKNSGALKLVVPEAKNETVRYKRIRLPIGSPALSLIQRIRDEAHRFAITYHRKLRSKSLLA